MLNVLQALLGLLRSASGNRHRGVIEAGRTGYEYPVTVDDRSRVGDLFFEWRAGADEFSVHGDSINRRHAPRTRGRPACRTLHPARSACPRPQHQTLQTKDGTQPAPMEAAL